MIVKGGRKILFKTFKPRIKVTSQTKFNICTHDLPISEIARILDKFLPNKIFVPVNGATKRVTLYLKNRTLNQITNASGLALKSYFTFTRNDKQVFAMNLKSGPCLPKSTLIR